MEGGDPVIVEVNFLSGEIGDWANCTDIESFKT